MPFGADGCPACRRRIAELASENAELREANELLRRIAAGCLGRAEGRDPGGRGGPGTVLTLPLPDPG
ncbi:hypothetical protein [Kitasatospora sp. NPDC093806]|uniref:hypothetical protein n=1 Tax=Kitasatospora sp. NPDC093806 TaxID=3155075 RepID=UPI00344029BA